MKKGLFILFGIFASRLISAQEYEPLLDTTKQWNFMGQVVVDECGGNFNPLYDYTLAERFRGDTVINGQHYKKLEACRNDSTFKNWHFYNYCVREVVDSQKVYLHTGWCSDVVLYDFSLQPGDSLVFLGYKEVIDSIATKFIANKNRKVQYITSYLDMGGLELIEGIGTKYGLYDHFEWATGRTGLFPTYKLICFSQNDETLYQSGNACFVYKNYADIPNENMDSDLIIFPNPASDNISVQLRNQISGAALSFLSLDGRIVYKKAIAGSLIELPVNEFNNGIYYILISKNNQSIINRKIVIRH